MFGMLGKRQEESAWETLDGDRMSYNLDSPLSAHLVALKSPRPTFPACVALKRERSLGVCGLGG